MVRLWTEETEEEAAHLKEAGRSDGKAGGAGAPESGRGRDDGAATVEPGESAPEALRLERRRDGQLWASRGEEQRPVRVRRLFPWSEQDRHVSLRDADDEEFAMIGPDDELDLESRHALDAAVVSAGFVLEVTRVIALEDEVEIRVWRVETRQGPRTFQTALDDWPREMPGGGLLIRDVSGDLYRVPDPGAVDANSRKLLWAFVG